MSTPAVEGFDPASPTFAEDRFAVLAALREQGPVAYVPAIDMWAVTGYQAVREVLADPGTYANGGTYLPSHHLPAASFAAYPADGPLWRYSMVSSDGEQHRRLRGPIARAFTAARVRALEPDVLDDACHLLTRLAAQLAEVATADLLAGFARPLPARTIARFFGLPVEEAARFSAWSEAFTIPQVPGLPEAAYVHAAGQLAAFDAYVRDLVTGDPDQLGEGIVRVLVTGAREGSHDLTEDEMVGGIATTLFAGHETTVATLGNVLVRLLADRDRWAALAGGHGEVDPLLEELLRVDTSGIGLFRTLSAATSLAGVDLPTGAKMWVAFGAANRDPGLYAHPDAVAPGRRQAPPVTFGHGLHSCIGVTLARTQVRAAITEVPAALPALTLVRPSAEVPNFILRAQASLAVRLGDVAG